MFYRLNKIFSAIRRQQDKEADERFHVLGERRTEEDGPIVPRSTQC